MEINGIKKVDKSNMRKIILDFPKQFRIGVKAAKNVYLESWNFLVPPENIIICGMGASGLPGDILVTLRPLNVFVYKNYQLPPQAGNESLIICVSYSGNTEEVLSSFQTAINRHLSVISITTGGELGRLSKKYNTPCVKLPPPLLPPRLALGELFAALLQVLQNHNLLEKSLVEELLKVGSLRAEGFEAQGKKLVKKIFRKIPVIYTSRRFREIGWIWKNSLNETAKIIAFCNYFPELNHGGEIVGFDKINEDQISNKKICVLILRDKEGSYSRILKQMDIAKDLIEKEGVDVDFIDMEGKTFLEKIFSTIILGFWTAYWLALEYKVDPTPSGQIAEFKRRLAKV